MHSKLQSIAGLIAAAFLVMSGMSVAYAQQNSANPQQNIKTGIQQNTKAGTQQNSAAGTQPKSAANTQNKTISSVDKGFVVSAMQDGMLEIALAKQAVAKTSNPDVKAFANRIIEDHTNANQKLGQIAQKEGLKLPEALSSKGQKKLRNLSKLTGSKFDDAYIKFAVNAHKKAISAFQNEAKKGADPSLKTFASQTTPTLREHLTMAQSVNRKLAAARSTEHPWWEFWKSGKNG